MPSLVIEQYVCICRNLFYLWKEVMLYLRYVLNDEQLKDKRLWAGSVIEILNTREIKPSRQYEVYRVSK